MYLMLLCFIDIVEVKKRKWMRRSSMMRVKNQRVSHLVKCFSYCDEIKHVEMNHVKMEVQM